MRRPLPLVTVLVAMLIAPLAAHAAAVPENNRDAVRAQLAQYFRDIDKNSPTVFGSLARSPETMKAIQSRIASMDDAELARFESLIEQAPDWKAAPEAFASALPPELRAHVSRVGKEYTDSVPRGEKMREDVRALVGVLKLLPEAKLRELGLDAKMIASLEATFSDMPALEAAMLQRHAAETTSWNEKSALAMHALPPALQRGMAALAEHGPLTEKDVAELETFRTELAGLLLKIETLPDDIQAKIDVASLRGRVEELRNAPPDVLFMVRHNMPPETLDALRRNVAFLERLSKFTDAEKKDLDAFRDELSHVFSGAEGDASEMRAMLATLEPQHLFFLQQRMASYGQWQFAFPATYQALAQPETQARLEALRGAAPDPVAVRSLEAFRQEALTYIDSLAATDGIDAKLVARARKTIETATADRLEIIRSTVTNAGSNATPIQLLSIVVMHEINWNCSLTFTAVPRVCTPGGCENPCSIVGEDCTVCVPEVCTPAVNVTVSFDSICNPLEDAIETVEHGIVGTANAIVETMRSGIQTAINTVQTTINTAISSVTNVLNTTISAITSTINSVWTFLQTIPDLAWNAIKTALDLLLDIPIRNGVTVRDLVARGVEHALTSMKTLLGLAEGWWTAVSTFTLPAIPCPPAGFHTPFGDVGDGAAADNYGRYKLVIDGIIDMIPDTELSLKIKIPAQLLYMSFDFFGLCLEQAAEVADDNQAAERHGLVLSGFTDLQTYIGTQIAGFSAQSGDQTDALVALLNSQGTALRSTITTQSGAIQTLLDSESSAIQSLVNNESDEIQSLLVSETDTTQDAIEAFRDLNLRLTIERALRGGVGSEIGHLQLRAPWGYLELVSRIVRESIDAMIAAQETIGEAEKFFAEGVRLMGLGKDKDAFVQFAMAYRDAAK